MSSDRTGHRMPIPLATRKYSNELQPGEEEVVLAGWLQDIRKHGSIAFGFLRDKFGIVQLTVSKNEFGEQRFNSFIAIPRESVIAVRGRVVKNPQAKIGLELVPQEIEVLSVASAPLPLGVIDRVDAGLDTRLNSRFIDIRKPEIAKIFKLKALLIAGIHHVLREHGFIEIHTPKIVSAGAEGGATLFPIEYFGKRTYLAQSPQLYKQIMMATGMDRVYEIAPAFRAEPSDTVRHLSEFISLDVELAFIDSSEDVMRVAETVVLGALKYMREKCKKFNLTVNIDLPVFPFKRITFRECTELLAQVGKKVVGELDTETEKLLGEIMKKEFGTEFYFITEFPVALKRTTFYAMRLNEEVTGYFDLEYRGNELASGGQREHRYDLLLRQLIENNHDPKEFEFYLQAFRYGMPPHGGFGLGIDRFVQYLLKLSNIREAVLFPRDRSRVVP